MTGTAVAWVEKLVGKTCFLNVTKIDFTYASVTDADLKHLRGVPRTPNAVA